MLKSRNVQRDVVSDFVPRRRVRRLAAAVTRYKRLFAASTTFMLVLAVLLFGFILTDEPDAVTLGVGNAGVMDTSAADTLNPMAETVLPPEPGAALHGERVDAGNDLSNGAASYYGSELAGRPTASGESFDPDRLTAAHRTLPFGTRVRVTNLRNERSVVVRINDRGPFSGRRVLDLSYSAAMKIGMLQRGTERVRMEVLE